MQDFRRRVFVAEPSPIRVAVLPTLVLRAVHARFADVHTCESAALTRLCARAACLVQGGLPQYRDLGPQNFDPFLGTLALRVNFSSRAHSV